MLENIRKVLEKLANQNFKEPVHNEMEAQMRRNYFASLPYPVSRGPYGIRAAKRAKSKRCNVARNKMAHR